MAQNSRIEPGHADPLGAHWDGEGVNFALFSAHADKVELCLFSEDGSRELQRFVLPEQTNQVFHGYLRGYGPGTVYGYRVYGPYQPHLGHRFNHHKLLLDPYARQTIGDFHWSELHYGFEFDHEDKDLSFDKRDSASVMPKCVVIDLPQQEPTRSNRVHRSKTIIYETHVRGFTIAHPEVPPEIRGTFLGLGHEKVISYLKALGITSIELLPIQSFFTEPFLAEKGLSNYWGYNTLSFFAPHAQYLHQNNVLECRQMVERFHEAGIEVILDIVFNHTAEGGRTGPTLSFRGIDNLSYYRLQPEDKRFYINDTGCGNTINLMHPKVVQMIMDSLRYWVTVMKVDGFRFDLAPVLGRESHGFDQGSGFFDALLQDPTLSATKFIAEPWDIGPGGYQLGNFPPGWSEWNDRYRDTVRKFWRGDSGMLPEFARRIHGSSDIFEHSGRKPSASINFITSHDGYTLNDLVSYRERHNEMNLEDNRDGHRENYSDNYGTEGPTSEPTIYILRQRQQKNLLATLMLSHGTPMILAGDEFGRTQLGNNNAYCQDNALNWINWEAIGNDGWSQRDFVAHLIAIKRRFPILDNDVYVHEPMKPDDPLVMWFNHSGEAMQSKNWAEYQVKTLGYLYSAVDAERGVRQYLITLFHAGRDPIAFRLPKINDISSWEILFDTAIPNGKPDGSNCIVNEILHLFSCSSAMLFAETTSIQPGLSTT